jgi:hypothetical protein
VPGQGVFVQGSFCHPPGGGGCDDPNGCETERPFRLGHPREEAQAAPLEKRTMFSVQDAAVYIRSGVLELYDVSGRRAKEPKPGVYFSVKRDKAGAITSRRTVLVTR